MNVIDILNKLGWDILSFNNSIYKVRMTHERIKREQKKNEAGEINYIEGFDPLTKTFDICVEEVCFNNFVNLFVSFSEVGSSYSSFD
ncbi:MAG: hypothetical protein KH415_15175 [Clostridium sp.]|jgi:hypothetical protein|nr:hypothetical protein [Clostridium sp.]